MKNIRIITNRNFPDGKSKEWIEIDQRGVFFWVAEDHSIYKDVPVLCSFPVDIETVKDFFLKQGRVLDETLLPVNFKSNPYAVNI